MPHQDDIRKLLSIHNRRLQILKEQQALHGITVEPKILIEIKDIEQVIQELQIELEKLNKQSNSNIHNPHSYGISSMKDYPNDGTAQLKDPTITNTTRKSEVIVNSLLLFLEAIEGSDQLIQPDEKERLSVGYLLGQYGDPRIDPTHITYWCEIKGGSFLMGSTDDEAGVGIYDKPQQLIELPVFWIARYPLTNAQWGLFIDDGGYYEKQWWDREGWAAKEQEGWYQSRYWKESQFMGPNKPVVGISWYEAVAYTRWLSHKLGHPFFLPTEAQWEKAARGTDGRFYPWGNSRDTNRANVEGRNEATTPVGCYPHGSSPYGVLDMSGNISEWTVSQWFETYHHNQHPSQKSNNIAFVYRGGAWMFSLTGARCAFRNYQQPEYRASFLGMRLATSILPTVK